MAVDHNSDENRLLFLAALEQCGVDNWEGFDKAITLYEEWINEDAKEYSNDLHGI